MNSNELSPEARRRLWQCYLLLLELADQAEEEAGLDPELDENQELKQVRKPDEITQPEDDSPEIGQTKDKSGDNEID